VSEQAEKLVSLRMSRRGLRGIEFVALESHMAGPAAAASFTFGASADLARISSQQLSIASRGKSRDPH
jgi:hypothetical protein